MLFRGPPTTYKLELPELPNTRLFTPLAEASAVDKDPGYQLRQIRAEPARVLLGLVFVRWRFGEL